MRSTLELTLNQVLDAEANDIAAAGSRERIDHRDAMLGRGATGVSFRARQAR